ncbi:SAM-dependent methyltransferase [Tsukamurella paurometabola]|uniref:S-adenosyl methyltransferase n=1 Tax=Tsukamurella paurometabola TaxID=2061 RepID=A0A3P8KGJ4_TSUPA|nr:SAM-dependent methyltransferase [Tsukamurella paurometabola]MBS4101841.1 SAM-dependent methyltransferase [Tsukamurella paurometabola]UEA82168.1 SAM-dependent methyltransferase [Tsukamurella paurometabola]VDR39208.1 S-adenosyl methyltransferase [Tsukamurella paurometabola]
MTNPDSAGVPSTSPLDMDRPNGSRLYDYFLGGTSYLPVDRDAGEEIAREAPHWALGARLTRTFARRAVQTMANTGIDQFLDLGSGITAGGTVHQLAQIVHPSARTVFVLREPIAFELARQLVGDDPRAAALKLDVRNVGAVLEHPVTRGLLDFDRPVGLLAVGTFVFVGDEDDPGGLLRRYRSALAPGSMIALSQVSDDSTHPEIAAELHWVRRRYEHTSTPLHLRPRAEILSWFDGTEILEPGLVRYGRWRPEFPLTEAQLRCDYGYVGVGRVG